MVHVYFSNALQKKFKKCQQVILTVELSPSKKICVSCLIKSPLKMMKYVLDFVLKVLVVLKLFKFLSRHFGRLGKTA